MPPKAGGPRVDPSSIYFTFSRIRPLFSCGRKIEDTIADIVSGKISAASLPPIQVLIDAGGNLYSLNNRRLFVFKTLQEKGLLDSVEVRLKPVPTTKRMDGKYTPEKCSKTARLMREAGLGGAKAGEGEGEGDLEDETGPEATK